MLSASSADGLNWTFDETLLLDHASVPAAVVTPEGSIRIYYVDASQAPEKTNCAESSDGGKTFAVLGCTISGMTASKAVDPSIVLLPDGRYRLYFYGSAQGDPGTLSEHSIYSAISEERYCALHTPRIRAQMRPQRSQSARAWYRPPLLQYAG